MKVQKLIDHVLMIKLFLTGKELDLGLLNSKISSLSYAGVYREMTDWEEMGLIKKIEVQEVISGGTKVRFQITPKGKKLFSKIPSLFQEPIKTRPVNKNDPEKVQGIIAKMRSEAQEIISDAIVTRGPQDLKKYLSNELSLLLEDSLLNALQHLSES